MVPLNVTLSHYKRRDVQEEMVLAAKTREVAVRFGDKFGQRPDTLTHPSDILELAKQKATSFHCSEELWKNPLQLKPEMKRNEVDGLRAGWDLVLDIDCSVFEYSRIAADLVVKALKYHNVESISCKFSGNKGFHIGVPFESFPEAVNGKKVELLFPDAPRRVAIYISEMIMEPLGRKILEFEKGSIARVASRTGKKVGEITARKKDYYGDEISFLDAKPFLEIDTILISSRHLFRMPYSLHEKSSLVSIPVNPEKILEFEKSMAKPENVKISKHRFLDKENAKKNDARELLVQTFDYKPKSEKAEFETKKIVEVESAVSEDFFPPCMNLIKEGLSDGRKRALFAVINFLTSIGWSYDEVEKFLKEWNANNREPLRENYLVGQLRYHRSQRKKILPPNCNNEMYYVAIGVCKPDNLCRKIKNPVSYAIRKSLHSGKEGKKQEKEASSKQQK